MALVINDRVKETSTTTGTGTFDLDGAVTGFETFVAGIASTNTTYYAIFHQGKNEWEVGLGTVTDAATDTLARTTVITSSNSDSAVTFTAGTKDVFCTLPASKAIYLDGSGNQVGGFSSLADDGSPQLGANLDVVTFDIVSTSNRDIDIIPNGTGDVNLGADAVQIGDNDANATLTTQGTGDLILNTNNGTNAGNVTLLDGANGNINLAPNGTGEIVVGAGDTAGDITSNGAYDLIIDTNTGTNAGNITLSNGANGAITLTPNGTGVVDIAGSMNPSVSSTGKALVMGF
jgi:hypothetical protein